MPLASMLPGPDDLPAAKPARAAHHALDLSRVDSLRILLFQHQPAAEVEVWAWNGPLTFIAENSDTLRRQPNDPGIHIYKNGENIVCENARKKLISHIITIKAQPDILIRIKAPGYPFRYYRGTIKITADEQNQVLQIVNKTGLEDYVGSVVGSEMNFTNIEALKVQAVVARTYALWNLCMNEGRSYEMTDDNQDQVYMGELIMKPWCRQVALATRGEIVTWSHQLILAAYSSTCGGRTAGGNVVWGGQPVPYLKPVDDHGACADSPHYRWTFRISRDSLLQALKNSLHHDILGITKLDTSRFGRITRVHLRVSPEQDYTVKGVVFRRILLRRYGERSLKSNWYSLQKANNMYIFKGRGMGHGVGLCQWGARGLALSGWHYREILCFYYTGVQIEDFHQFDQTTLPLAY